MRILAVAAASMSAFAQLADIAGKSVEVTDSITGVPMRVRVAPFRIGTAEVTQAEYRAITGANPAHHRSDPVGDARPVENVSWWDAIRYCNLRSAREGLDPVYDLATGQADFARNGYRLPTAAEWDLAAGAPAREGARLGPASVKDTRALLDAVAAGPRAVTASPAAANGLRDMTGNVWEWCHDIADPGAGSVHQTNNPTGPATGAARVLRGGSFASTSGSWSRGYRSSMDPSHRSRFTGFRVARNGPAPAREDPGDAWFEPYHRPPVTTPVSKLAPIAPDLAALRAKWEALLGAPAGPAPEPAARLISRHSEPAYEGRLMMLQTERDAWERIYVMVPRGASRGPRPVVITPYYDVDTPAGTNLGGRNYLPPSVRSFGLMAVQRGFIAIGIRWFGEGQGEGYAEAVANLALRHPRCTGLGKWVWDARRLVDWIGTLPEADARRIGIIGQSLGGKMALYAGAMDPRITAVVSSEPGIGFGFSNYEDFWYFGERLREAPAGTDQHELLALTAPRPFLLIGGESADGDKSWPYIQSARSVYERLGAARHIGFFNHRKGHTPTPEAARLSMDWLERFLTGR